MEPSSAPWRVVEADPQGSGDPPEPKPRDLPWVAIGALLIALVVGGSALLLALRPDPGVEVDGAVGASGDVTGVDATASDGAAAVEIVVEVGGAVVHPGVYRLPGGSRVMDAVTAAGGFGPRVDAALADRQLNLAAAVHDGDEIHVPARGEAAGRRSRWRRRWRVQWRARGDRPQHGDRRRRSTRCRGSGPRPPRRSSRPARNSVRVRGRPRDAQGPRARDAREDPGARHRRVVSGGGLPRAAWVAVGVASAAAASSAGVPAPAVVVVGLLVVALAAGTGSRLGRARRTATLAAGIGAIALGVRVLVGPGADATAAAAG